MTHRPTIRLASVSFINSLTLNYGLAKDSALSLTLDVPANLLDRIRTGQADLALLPTIDYQKLPGARLLAATGIGCEGPTLTVRLFCRCPIEQMKQLACDGDSHTSVALVQIILRERYGLRPELVPLSAADESTTQGRLLIGDKVVCAEPPGFGFQHDLGEEWYQLTGLPFVFAAWTAGPSGVVDGMAARLIRANTEGLNHLPELIKTRAVPMGWPYDLALKYFTQYLRFTIGPRQIQAIELFHQMAAKHGLIESARKVEIVQ